jgi:protocatechuate 3,4-dioxygenase beta subunit
MRIPSSLLCVVLASAAVSSQPPELIPAPYLSPKYVAAADAPSSIVVAGREEPGDRFVVTGRVMDGATPLAGVSIYVFQADADGLYTKDGNNSDQNARLHGAMRSDKDGRYRFESIRPRGYNDAPAHVHYVVTAPGYKPRMFDLWLADDPLIEKRRKAGVPVPGAPGQVEVRPVTRDASGVWHATRDLAMLRD